MDIDVLRIFKAVAEEGSISGAAQKLNYVQPNVTKHIRKLEQEMGVPLFYRKPRGVVPTSAGRTLLIYAEKALRLMEEAEEAVRETGEMSGQLKIGSTQSAAAVRLPSILTRFHAEHPQVEVMLITANSEQLIGQVLNYELDGAFVAGAIEHPNLNQKQMFEEELTLVSARSAKSVAASARRSILVFSFGCAYRARLELWLQENGLLPYKILEIGTLEGILGCVAAGMGYTVLPRSVVNKSIYANKFKMVALPKKYSCIQTIFLQRKDVYQTRALKELLGMIIRRQETLAVAQ
jgi:DNA-binding transcriptional LysR family regulator